MMAKATTTVRIDSGAWVKKWEVQHLHHSEMAFFLARSVYIAQDVIVDIFFFCLLHFRHYHHYRTDYHHQVLLLYRWKGEDEEIRE